jgi:hypothetical protein
MQREQLQETQDQRQIGHRPRRLTLRTARRSETTKQTDMKMKISFKVSSVLRADSTTCCRQRAFGRPGTSLLDYLREWPPDILPRPKAMLQPLEEVVLLLRHPAPLRGLHWG